MAQPTDEKLKSALGGIMADAFNRSLRALEDAGAIDATRLRKDYQPGSKYYDIVTAQLEYTAKYGAKTIRDLFRGPSSDASANDA